MQIQKIKTFLLESSDALRYTDMRLRFSLNSPPRFTA